MRGAEALNVDSIFANNQIVTFGNGTYRSGTIYLPGKFLQMMGITGDAIMA